MSFKILIVDDEEDLREILGCYCEMNFPLSQILYAADGEAGLKILNENKDTQLIISDYKMPIMDGSQFLQKVKEDAHYAKIPFSFCSAYGADLEKHSKSGNVFHTIIKPEILPGIQSLAKLYNEKFKENLPAASVEKDYFPISISFLHKVGHLNCDLYLNLGVKKFIKIHLMGDFFGAEEIKRYEAKKVKYLYVKESDRNKFLSVLQELSKTFDTLKTISGKQFVSSNETLLESLTLFDFSPDAQEHTKKWVEASVSSLLKTPNFKDFISQIIEDSSSFMAKHTSLLNLFAIEMAMAMDWKTAVTFHKLSLASLLHDIAVNLDSPEIESLQNIKVPSEGLSKSYREHPARSAEICRRFKEIPPDVDRVILEHHELPDGKGFPRGLMAKDIGPLSALFIIAHFAACFALERHNLGQKLDKTELIQLLQSEFPQTSFKKIIEAYKKSQ